MSTRIIHSFDTEQNWNTVNPVIKQGELIFKQKPNGNVVMAVGDQPGGVEASNCAVVWDNDEANSIKTQAQSYATQAQQAASGIENNPVVRAKVIISNSDSTPTAPDYYKVAEISVSSNSSNNNINALFRITNVFGSSQRTYHALYSVAIGCGMDYINKNLCKLYELYSPDNVSSNTFEPIIKYITVQESDNTKTIKAQLWLKIMDNYHGIFVEQLFSVGGNYGQNGYSNWLFYDYQGDLKNYDQTPSESWNTLEPTYTGYLACNVVGGK